MIEVTGVSKSFGNIKAVDSLSFKIRDGEIVGLLGPNGAGKTTTMRIMTGFLSSDTGRVAINGIDILESPIEALKDIGYMPEGNPLYKEMLVSEMLEFAANVRGLLSEEKKEGIEFAIDSTAISDVYHRPIAELSKGYRQRVGMALVLLHKPSVLILDEPTEGLDPNQRSEIRSLIRKLSKGHTVIISTHVMQEVEAVCNRIILIDRGRLVADGTPAKLKREAGKGSGLRMIIEGNKVYELLRKIEGVSEVSIIKKRGKKLDLSLTTSKVDISPQPQISRLAARNGWIIWELKEIEKNLEEVFQELTK